MVRFAISGVTYIISCLFLLMGLVGNAQGQSDLKEKWEKTVQAAKKEGRVNLYISTSSADMDAINAEFLKEYPEIKVISIAGRGSQLATRILAERRAGKFLADVYGGSGNAAYNMLHKAKALDPIKPVLIHPEVLDESGWYQGKHRYLDPETKYIFAYKMIPRGATTAYNTNLVNPNEFNSYRDFLNPKWKGKIVSLDPRRSSPTMMFFYYHSELGPEYIKQLYVDMDITISNEMRQITDWLARGRYALCLGCRRALEAKDQGLPVDRLPTWEFKEGASLQAGGGVLSLPNRAPHPNASKVYINWFLSRKGQETYVKLGFRPDPPNSFRVDIPKDVVALENRVVDGRRYLDITRPEWTDMTPIFKLLNEVKEARQRKGK